MKKEQILQLIGDAILEGKDTIDITGVPFKEALEMCEESKEGNLPHEGDCPGFEGAIVYGDAGDALVYGDARVDANTCSLWS